MDILLIAIVSLYNICFVICVLHILRIPDNGAKRPKEAEKIEEVIKVEHDNSIVGESRSKIQRLVPLAAKSTPVDATQEKGDDIADMPATFASQTKATPSAKVAKEDMDSAFEDIRMETTPTSYSDDDDDYDGVPNEAFASGSTFEEIEESVKVASNPDATPEQKQSAGKVFVEMEGTQLYERLMTNSKQWKIRIRAISNSYLGAIDEEPARAGAKRKKFTPPTTVDEFNIRDYV